MKKRSGIKLNWMNNNKSNKNKKNIVLIVIASIAAALGTAVFGILKWRGKKCVDDISTDMRDSTASKTSETMATSDTSGKSDLSNESVSINSMDASRVQILSHIKHRKINPGELDWEALAKEKEKEQIRKGEIPDYMLKGYKWHKFVNGLKKRKWKVALSSLAMLLAVAVVCGNIAQYLRPAKAVAKESFLGIGKIVEEHGEDNPYKILDIVPSEVIISTSGLDDATGSAGINTPDSENPETDNSESRTQVSTAFTFTTGTLGYLAGGGVPFANELEAAFTGNPIFRHAASREELFNKLVPSPDSFPQIKYMEAYGGVHNVSETNGWTLLFPNQAVTLDDDYNITSGNGIGNMAEGTFHGTPVQYTNGEDKTGYDFIWLSGQKSLNRTQAGLSNKFIYFFNEDNGKFYAMSLDEYAKMPEGTPAYKASVSSAINALNGPEGFSNDVDIYEYDENEGRYVYQGTVGEVFKDWINNTGSEQTPIDQDTTINPDTTNQDSTTEPGTIDQDNITESDTIDQGTTTKPGITDQGTITEPGTIDQGTTTEPGTTDQGTITEPDTTDQGTTTEPDTIDQGTTIDPTELETNSVSVISDTVPVDIGRNTILAGEWRRLAAEDALVDDVNISTTLDTTIPPTGDVNIPPTDSLDATPPSSDNTDIPQEGGTTPPSNGDWNTTQEGGDEADIPPANSTPQQAEPSEGNAEGGKIYYVLSFERMGDDELAELTMTDVEVASDDILDAEEAGITLFSATENTTSEFIYVGSGQGNYKLIETGNKNDPFIGVYNVPVYFKCQAGNDWLRQYVFSSLSGGDNANSSFRIEVTTVRADQVTVDMVEDADLVYMESGQNTFLSAGLAVNYIQHIEGDSLFGDANDMDAGVVSAILRRATDDLMPIIVDYAITEETDTEKYAGTNYQLLAKALFKRDLAEFYEAMNDGVNLIANLRMNLENESDNDNNLDFPNKYSNSFNYSYVNQNIYVVKNELLVSDDFAEYFDDFKANAGFGDVLAAIEMENTTLIEEDRIYPAVSKARAIQYIINYSVGIMGEFDDLTILELQPSANINQTTGGVISDLHIDTDTEKNSTRLYWKTDSMTTGKQILYSNKIFTVTTDVKSVVEFNGEWEDINGTYDMIFVGLDGMNLNLSNEKTRRPIYNNDNLNGKVYHLGDESGSGTYDSNDITAQKMADLLEYLQAGYPIVVENNCFTKGTARNVSSESINTKYIDEGTCMYRFLAAAVSDERYRDSIFTVSDTTSSAMFMARVKTAKPRIEWGAEDNTEEGKDIGKVQSLVLDENNEYHGRIAFEVRNNRGEEYLGSTQMRLYADMNYDGIFGIEEELSEGYVNEGNVIDVTISGMGPGVIPWKLEVSDIGNAYRRDSIQGYFELIGSYPEEVRVLQIAAQKAIAPGPGEDIDLQYMYNIKDDSMLARYLKDAESKANLSFEFETLTPDMLTTRLSENSKYLNQWDIVVLTVDNGVTVDGTAFANYINEGRSLLVCNQNKGDNSAGLATEMLGWSGGRTFVSLGASNLHRYANLKSEMYSVQHGNLRAEKINEGSILYYPYQLSGSSFNFGNTEGGLRASEYLLDFESNLKTETSEAYVTAWLTLGGGTDTAYGISPRDARNNYYCYSKGNVVYLAQSEYHYTYDTNGVPEGQEGADECKFFVNALMAAYSAGVHNSDVSIVSGFAKTSATVKSISVPFDQEWRETADDNTKGILDETVDVYFKFADSNIGANKKVTVSFYYEDPAGTQEFVVGDTTVKATPFGSDIWTVTDNKLVQVTSSDPQNPDQVSLVPGKVYQIKAPVVSLRMLTDEKTNDAGIYVLVESEFIRTGKTYKIDGFGTVSLNRAKLFLLE